MMQYQAKTAAMDVANWFLNKCWQEGEGIPQCDQLKLYKLVYYAHAWYLAFTGTALFDEDVEAWPHGPVVRDLYIEFKRFGRKPINRLGQRLHVDQDKQARMMALVPQYDGAMEQILNSVWDTYKEYTGIQLSNSTHDKGEPWDIVSRHYSLHMKPKIPNEIIEQVFRNKLNAPSS
ncbi:MAG: SocA family protein [Rhizobiales bacterium]|nr:SocA family protein [Hyphomicrobiales bacterium]